MEQTNETVELKIVTTKAPEDCNLRAAAAAATAPATTTNPPSPQGEIKMSNTSRLTNFLPTGTLLTFEIVLPLVYRTGECSQVNVTMIYILLCLCILSCFLFHFTDSIVVGPNRKVYYAVVTPGGLWVPREQRININEEIPSYEHKRLRQMDIVHAVMSVMVFVTIALSDHRIIHCLFDRHSAAMVEVMESLPVMVGAVFSALFLMFPSDRRGVGLGG